MLLVLAVLMIASGAHASGNLAPVQVLTDSLADNVTTEDATPAAASDLVAGFIGETDSSIDFVWQVASLDDTLAASGPTPVIMYYEFQLIAPDGSEGLFSVRARLAPAAGTGGVIATFPTGSLQGNCTTTGTLVTCTPVAGAQVTVTVDAATDTVKASVRRTDLKSNGGAELAVDGTTLDEATLFDGIATCMTTPVVTPGSACDQGDLDDTYVLGTPRA
jgi:hypothetical protein